MVATRQHRRWAQMTNNTQIVDQAVSVVELCAEHSQTVCLIGDSDDQLQAYQTLIAQHGLTHLVCEDPVDVPLFSAIVFLDICDHEYYQRVKTFNFCFKYSTLIDVAGYVDLDMCEQYIDFSHGHPEYCGEYGVMDLDTNGDFRQTLMQLFPELTKHDDQIAVIYDGAIRENCLQHVDFGLVTAHIKKIVSLGRNKVIFYNGDETIQCFSVLAAQRVAEYFDNLEVKVQFFYFCSGLQAETAYTDFCAENKLDPKLVVVAANRFEIILQDQLAHLCLSEPSVYQSPYRIGVKEKNFVCFNRVPRRHRCMLLHKLWCKGLVADSYYSFGNESQPNITQGLEPGDAQAAEWFSSNIDKFPMILNMKKQSDNPVNISTEDKKYHDNSYFSLVCETYYYKDSSIQTDIEYMDSIFISEKIYKPLAFKHPFLLVGLPGTLQCLRDFGYRTFDPYINEDYDTIVNDQERMNFIVAEVERLCSQSKEQWQDWQKGVADIVEYNYGWLQTHKDLRITKDIEKHFV